MLLRRVEHRSAPRKGVILMVVLAMLTLFAIGPWILRVLVDFTHDLYANIPSVIG